MLFASYHTTPIFLRTDYEGWWAFDPSDLIPSLFSQLLGKEGSV